VSVNAGVWHISFSNGDESIIPSEQETLEQLQQYSFDELLRKTVGLDRGVAVPLMAGNPHQEARAFLFKDIQLQRLEARACYRARWQRIGARRVKGSKNRAKAMRRAAKAGLYSANVREDFAHQSSHVLVSMNDVMLYVFEALKVKNMTASAAGTLEAPGKNVAQKRGLNRSILASVWGNLKAYTKYKALRLGKLVIEVPAHFSSQECSACGFIHANNRVNQSRFICLRCEHSDNADANAAQVLARRGAKAVAQRSFTFREKKQVGGHRRKPAINDLEAQNAVGPERSELTPVETQGRRGRKSHAHGSQKQECSGVTLETPTTRHLCV
jgi:putative transposase